MGAAGSPVSDDGRGLKPVCTCPGYGNVSGSPVSDDGRGLKRPVFDCVTAAEVTLARQR